MARRGRADAAALHQRRWDTRAWPRLSGSRRRAAWEVTVVAPDREQSATSHSLTLHHPVRPIMRGERRWQVDGTPTDCVMLAVEALMDGRPDFVISGVNHGQNMGEDVLY